MTDCVFCDVVAGEEPARVVAEGDRTLAFLDAAPATPGHTLVVPTDHCARLPDLDGDRTAALFRTVRRVAGAVEAAVDPDGIAVVQSNGAAAGQEIDHVHVHVVPRFAADDVTVEWSHEALAESEERSVAAAIRAELG